MFDSAPIGMALVSLDGRYLRVNRSLCEIVGYPMEVLLQKTFRDITHPDDLETDDAQVARLLSGELRRYSLEKRYCHADGRVIWVNLSRALVSDRSGEPLYFITQVQDVTDRKHAERLLDLVFHASPDLLCVANFEGYFVRVNPSWPEQLGWSEEELLSRPFFDFVHPDDREPTTGEYASNTTARHGSTHFENRYRTKSGEYRWLQWNSITVPGENLIVANARDMTEYKRQQAELARSNRDLEQFASVAAHDLRAPLAPILGFVDLVLNASRSDLHPEDREFLLRVRSQVTRMSELIDDLLAYSRVGHDEQIEVSVDLEKLVAEVAEGLEQVWPEATITVGELPTLTGDRGQLRQLFQNLLTNGVKFSRPGVPPAVRVDGRHGEGECLITVADNGIGIPEEARSRVFEMFQRLHGQETYAGTGIGLAICQRVVERHGGRIWVEGNDDGGTTFHVTLPDR
ncbi:MAG: PAS domain S-box protein [Actinomycetota bacterium]|nr:PAS domain S-box protein [Actinomycetota bacterium]